MKWLLFITKNLKNLNKKLEHKKDIDKTKNDHNLTSFILANKEVFFKFIETIRFVAKFLSCKLFKI